MATRAHAPSYLLATRALGVASSVGACFVACGGSTVSESVLTTLASGETSIGIAVDKTNVYWTAPGAVMKVPLGGGTPTTLASGQQFPGDIAVNGANVCWTDS